jgi:ferric-dicitrate binding protein FerR (iron transport regulator)
MKESKQIGLHIVEYLLGGSNGNPDDAILAEWLASDESNKADFMKYKKIWDESRFLTETETFDRALAWEKINKINRRKEQRRQRFTRFIYALSGAAAAVALCMALSYPGIFEKDAHTALRMTVENGSRSEMTLPDGSVVKLNAGSSLDYSFDRKKKTRELYFQGEGFFKVAKSDYPFVVNTKNGLQVKVLGTTFNLCAYEEDAVVRTALLEGSVELSRNSTNLRLKAGEMALFDLKTNELKKEKGVLSHACGWVDNKLYMDEMALSEVCKKLERHYDVQITLHGNIGETIHYNGVLQEESITDVLNVLVRLSKVKYRVSGKNIDITSK